MNEPPTQVWRQSGRRPNVKTPANFPARTPNPQPLAVIVNPKISKYFIELKKLLYLYMETKNAS